MRRITSLVLAAALLTACLCACVSGPEGGQDKQVDLAVFAQAILEGYGFPNLDRFDPADEGLSSVVLENNYPGLKDMDLAQTEVYLAPISFTGEELVLVQSKNADDAAMVKDIFQGRIDAKTTDGPNNYPEELKLWQRSARVVSNGNYVMLVNHEDSEAIVSEFNELFK